MGWFRISVVSVLLSGWLTATASADSIPAAGRLEWGGGAVGATCSGVLVAPDLVLTAAHCLGGIVDGLAGGETTTVFRPSADGAGQVYRIAQAIRHPLFDPAHDPELWRLRFDLGLLRLETPVPADVARPLGSGPEARPGETLYIVSWIAGTDRPRQRACEVIPGRHGLVTLGCPVRGGESGSPILRRRADGTLEVVAIVSSRIQVKEQPLAQGSDVALRLPPLLSELGR